MTTSKHFQEVAIDSPYLQDAILQEPKPSALLRTRKRIKSFLSLHKPDGSPNTFLFSLPRSGSTWLMELIQTQPGFKTCDEPLDLRNPFVRGHSHLSAWEQLYDTS